MSKQYIDSQEHWEDSINDDIERNREMQREADACFENPNLIIPDRCQACEEIINDYDDVIDGMHAECFNEWHRWTGEYPANKLI